MEKRNLGKSGLRVSAVGLGCNNFGGRSDFAATQAVVHKHGLHHFVSCQERYSLLERDYEASMAAMVETYGLGLIPFSPLANGLLTGKYHRNRPLPEGARLTLTQRMSERYLTERNWSVVERLEGFAAELGHSLLELAFGWLLARPAVASVIAGATRPEQVAANLRAAAAWRPTADEMHEIDRLTAG